MSKDYSVADARRQLADILDAVQAGDEVRLTRRGRPVAVLVSPEQYDSLRNGRADFAASYQSYLENHSVKELDLDDGYFRSLRNKGAGRKVNL